MANSRWKEMRAEQAQKDTFLDHDPQLLQCMSAIIMGAPGLSCMVLYSKRVGAHTGAVWHPTACYRPPLHRSSAISVHLGVVSGGDLCPPTVVCILGALGLVGGIRAVPDNVGSWLWAERMENVRCCFCLTLGPDPAEIITEEFTLPCQICRYFAVLRADALFL